MEIEKKVLYGIQVFSWIYQFWDPPYLKTWLLENFWVPVKASNTESQD